MRGSRDPDFPKGIRTRRNAIEKAIDKLSQDSRDSRGAFEVQQNIQRQIEALEKHARYKEGVDVYELGRALWRKVSLAKDQAIENYRAGLQRELSQSREALRASGPRPGTYEHELALMRGGYRRDRTRSRSRGRR